MLLTAVFRQECLWLDVSSPQLLESSVRSAALSCSYLHTDTVIDELQLLVTAAADQACDGPGMLTLTSLGLRQHACYWPPKQQNSFILNEVAFCSVCGAMQGQRRSLLRCGQASEGSAPGRAWRAGVPGLLPLGQPGFRGRHNCNARCAC
jgi:hypothetical protein